MTEAQNELNEFKFNPGLNQLPDKVLRSKTQKTRKQGHIDVALFIEVIEVKLTKTSDIITTR